MNKINCPACGLANWSNVENCLRCKSLLDGAYTDPGAASYSYSENRKSFSISDYSGTIAIVFCALVVMGVAYLFFSSGSVAKSDAAATTSATSPSTSNEVTVAVPPDDFGISAPQLEGFDKLIKDELSNQNGVQALDAVKAGTSLTIEEKFKRNEREVADGMRGLCNGGGGMPAECNGRLQSIKADQAAREWNDQMSSTKFCPPKIDGPFKIAEPGRYHKYGDKIYYSGKVQAEGFEGINENGVCTFAKSAIVPLTAKIYLRWSNGWLGASQGEFNTVSLAYNKQVSAEKKEEYEKKRDERLAEQRREAANKRMADKVFGALDK